VKETSIQHLQQQFLTGAILLFRVLLAAAIVLGLPAHAQDYPSKPIKILVPFPPGGSTDVFARLVGGKLWAKWGQPVVVENRGGDGGNIGAAEVYNAKPDGHTLLVSPPSTLLINKSLYAKLAYDSDLFVPVTVIGTVPTVLVVHPKLSANSVQELISFSRAHPERLNYASQGNGSTAQLTTEMFKAATGIKIAHVPYKGAAPALTDLIAGHVDMMFANLASALPFIRSGQLRAIGVASEKRNGFLPGIPTMSEVLPGFVSETWIGMVAPPKTSPEIANKISAAIAEALRLPDVAKGIADLSADPVGSTPAEMAVFVKQEGERWGRVIRSAGAKAD
jgi:tripartite-type tricarboxylate transporter receptor subunit TctC